MLVAVLLLTGSACRNACQDVCKSMSEFALECGITVSDADLDACYSRQTNPERDDAKACREFGDLESIRNQWTCEDVGLYFGGGSET